MSARPDYHAIKALARQRRVSVDDLLALAKANDPFYVGAPAQRAAAEWFSDHFAAANFGNGVHLRRVHYFLVSIKATLLDGKPYENTLEAWHLLSQASKSARYLGLVDPASFDDRRNPPPQVFSAESWDASVEVEHATPVIPLLSMPALPELGVTAPSADQPYALEIWCEKSTMNDVLLPICQRYGATLVTGLGELSITACQRLVERVRDAGKPTRIIYLSDFDPAGQSMPLAAARKIEFLARKDDVDVRLYSLALTAAQVTQFKLPRVPIKESERRREAFEATHGTGAVELDALEALVPGELARIVEEALAPFFDPHLEDAIDAADEAAHVLAYWATMNVHSAHEEAIAAARDEWQAISEAIVRWRAAHAGTWQAIREDLQGVEIDLDFPDACVPDDAAWPLFDSRRGYEEQIEAYRMFRSGGTKEKPGFHATAPGLNVSHLESEKTCGL